MTELSNFIMIMVFNLKEVEFLNSLKQPSNPVYDDLDGAEERPWNWLDLTFTFNQKYYMSTIYLQLI